MSTFETNSDAQEANTDGQLRHLLRRAIRSSGLSPEGIAKHLTDKSGRNIKTGLIRAWTAEAKHRWHLPADLIPPLCEILQDDGLQRQLLSPRQREALDLGESTGRVISLLQKAVSREAKPRKSGRARS